MESIPSINVNELGEHHTVLDVREPYEWEAGHINGAVHIPVDQVPERLDELDPDDDVHVVCRSGGRSSRITQWLSHNGYSAVNVAGGMGAWMDANKPMVSETGEEPYVK